MKRRLHSFRHAFRGIADLWRFGVNFRLQVVAAGGITAIGLWLGFARWEWVAVVICMALVLAGEALNSALEELCDEVTEEQRERIRRAKDMAAGGVLLASLASVFVAILIMASRLLP